jgi:GNAT superfamily N-acetyltransferase
VAALTVTMTDDPAVAAGQARRYLESRPVDHNLVLSLLHQRTAHPEPGRYWIIRLGRDVAGVALQSPPTFSAALTPMSREAVEVLATTIADGGTTDLPGVIAEAGTAAAFAGRWSELVRDRVAPEEGQRIYRLGELRPAAGVPGGLRRATGRDRDLLVAWRVAFSAETGAPGSGDPAAAIDRDLIAGRMFVWDDEGAACAARATVPVAGVSRIGGVYTPPGLRRRGYASGCVGSLCSWVRQEDGATCILYTQLANPTSNAIYRRLGFEAVAEVLSYRFRPGSPASSVSR